MANAEQLLIFIVPTELEDNIIDMLMLQPKLSGFNIKSIKGFSQEHSHFNMVEQVQGYRELSQFEILTNDESTEPLLQKLKPICSALKIRYWFIPVIESGHF